MYWIKYIDSSLYRKKIDISSAYIDYFGNIDIYIYRTPLDERSHQLRRKRNLQNC